MNLDRQTISKYVGLIFLAVALAFCLRYYRQVLPVKVTVVYKFGQHTGSEQLKETRVEIRQKKNVFQSLHLYHSQKNKPPSVYKQKMTVPEGSYKVYIHLIHRKKKTLKMTSTIQVGDQGGNFYIYLKHAK